MSGDMAQLGFDALLAEADAHNEEQAFARETAHLPGTLETAIPYLKDMLARHHALMLAADLEAAIALREKAHLLAQKLNGGAPGILADEDAPGYVLDQATAAEAGQVPIWGQSGVFDVSIKTRGGSMEAQIEMGGVFGIGATAMPYLGFSVRAVDPAAPFLSSTGYRSFLGCSVPPETGLTPDRFARQIMTAHIESDLKGRLVAIDPKYRERQG